MRAFDWGRTALGEADEWPQSLQTAVGMMLGAAVPLAIVWGRELILLYNDAWRDLIGEKHPEALGQPVQQVFPEIWPTMGPAVAAVMAGKGAQKAESQLLPLIRGGEQEEAWFDYILNPILCADGSVGGLFNIATEVTGRVQAEKAQRQSEAQLREASRAAQLGVYARDLRRGEDYWSPEFLALYGLEADESLQLDERIPAAVHPEDREQVKAEARARMARMIEPTFSSEHRIVRPDGEIRWMLVQGRVRFDEAGEPLATYGVAMDITARKEAEAAEKKSERLLQAILEQMPSGVHVAEAPSGRDLFYNEEYVRILGHDPIVSEERADYERYGAVHADGTPYRPDEYPMLRAFQGEEIRQEEMRYRRGDGRVIILSVNAAPLRNEAGEIMRAIVTFHDISALKRAQEALAQLNATLEERVEKRTQQVRQQEARIRELAAQLTLAEHEERGRIAQILHDDLQQQLYALQMQLTFLRAGTKEQEALAEIAIMEEMMVAATRSTRELSLDLSPPILEGEGLAEAIGWLATRMQERYGLAVELKTPETGAESGPPATASRSFPVPERDRRVLLFRAVRELLFNAVKHAGVARVTVRLQQVDDCYRIDVVDEGTGFDADAVFGAETPVEGQGLWYTRERLQLIGGRLDLASTPGSGTRVTIIAPPQEE